MAADGDGLSFNVEDFDTAAIIKLQAVCRRRLLNKYLQETREEYEEIVRELDGTGVIVDWPRPQICRPVVRMMPKGTCKPKLAAYFGGDRNIKEIHGKIQACEYSDSTRFTQQSNGTDTRTQTAPQKNNQEVQTDLPQMVSASTLCFTIPVTGFAPTGVTPVAAATDAQLQGHGERQKQNGCHQISDSRRHEVAQVETHLTSRMTSSFAGKTETFTLKDSGTCEKIGTTLMPCTRVMQSSQGSRLTHATSPGTDLPSVTCQTIGQGTVVGSVCGDHGDQTSVWESSCSDWPEPGSKELKSARVCEPTCQLKIPQVLMGSAQLSEGKKSEVSKEELLQARKNIAMELLWVQQAIISRKNYLRLKSQMK